MKKSEYVGKIDPIPPTRWRMITIMIKMFFLFINWRCFVLNIIKERGNMIIYNVTVNINTAVEAQWFKWMKEIHIPEVMSTGYFKENRFLKMLNEVPEAEGSTYAVQYFAESLDLLNEYTEKESSRLQKHTYDKFPNQFVAFRTILEVV
jgi:hypothetical protein